MRTQTSTNTKLMVYRLVTIIVIALLLVQLGIVTDTLSASSNLTLFIIALFPALILTMILDKYIVRLVTTGTMAKKR